MWNDFFDGYDHVVDFEMEVGFGVGVDITAIVNGIKVSGSAEIVHKRTTNEHGTTEEFEEAKVSVDLTEALSASLGSTATADNNWSYDNVELIVTILDNDIVSIGTDNKGTSVEIKDQTIEIGFAGYIGIGGGAKLTINISELARILGLLPEKQKFEFCHH